MTGTPPADDTTGAVGADDRSPTRQPGAREVLLIAAAVVVLVLAAAGLTAVLPRGEILRCRPVPRSAAGPDLRRLLIGSEGTLAVVTEATLACRARPAAWDWLVFGFPEFTALADGLREAVRAETGAAVIRGYDETDAQLSFGPLGHPGGCVGILGFPAGLPGLAARKQAGAEAMHQAGASGELGPRYGEHWWEHRNDAVDTYARNMYQFPLRHHPVLFSHNLIVRVHDGQTVSPAAG